LRFVSRAVIIPPAMNCDYDAVILGGAFSGAATALMLKRRQPDARVLLIEKAEEFDRKVGESTTELSSCYMTRILGINHHLGFLNYRSYASSYQAPFPVDLSTVSRKVEQSARCHYIGLPF
jgi:choline dehydrogenase-like flavoprotein